MIVLHVVATGFFLVTLLSALALLTSELIDGWQDVRRALGLDRVPARPRHAVRVRRTVRQQMLARAAAPMRAAA